MTAFPTNTRQYNNLSYISFKLVLLYNYTLLPATINALEISMEDIFKPFQLFRSILDYVSSTTQAPSLQC